MQTVMKSILKALCFALVIALTGIQCSEDFLNTSNPNQPTPENLITSVENLEFVVKAMYSAQKGFSLWGKRYFAKITGCLSHEIDQSWVDDQLWNDMCHNEVKPGNAYVADLWRDLYKVVGQANDVLDNAVRLENGASDADIARLKKIEGEAYFIRGWAYFELIRFFGEANQPTTNNRDKMGVPLILAPVKNMQEAQSPRANVGAVYDQIISDLKEAFNLLPESRDASEVARATRWGAKGLLGKVYVTMQDWSNAETTLKDVIDNGKSQSGASLSLLPFEEYKVMFNEQYEFSSESLYELNMVNMPSIWGPWDNPSGSGHSMLVGPSYVDPSTGESRPTGWSNVFVHQKAVERLKGDPRIKVDALQPYVDSIIVDNVKVAIGKYIDVTEPDIEGWSIRKYVPLDGSSYKYQVNYGANIHILRLADVFLLYAETLQAQNNETDAREYANKVRRRAYGKADYNVPDPAIDWPASVTGNALRDSIRLERYRELYAEGQIWFDICRWGIGPQESAYYVRTRTGNIVFNEPQDYYLPIPQTELERNPNLKQSTGY